MIGLAIGVNIGGFLCVEKGYEVGMFLLTHTVGPSFSHSDWLILGEDNFEEREGMTSWFL